MKYLSRSRASVRVVMDCQHLSMPAVAQVQNSGSRPTIRAKNALWDHELMNAVTFVLRLVLVTLREVLKYYLTLIQFRACLYRQFFYLVSNTDAIEPQVGQKKKT